MLCSKLYQVDNACIQVHDAIDAYALRPAASMAWYIIINFMVDGSGTNLQIHCGDWEAAKETCISYLKNLI